MASISEDTGEETPLQVRLNGVATFIGIVGLSVAVSVLAVLLARFSHYAVVQVTIHVVAVPEGLPLAVTLTYQSDKLVSQMTVVEAIVGKKKINPPASSSQLHPSVVSLLSEGVAQNSTGNLGKKFDAIRSESTILQVFLFNSEKKRGGVAVLQLNQLAPAVPKEAGASSWLWDWRDKEGKMKIGLWGFGFSIGKKLFLAQGAAEIVLAACSGYLDSNGCLQSMNEDKDFFEAGIDEMAASSLRCVALAYRLCEREKVTSDEESCNDWILPEDNLVLLAIVGIKDPCRSGVKDTVKICMDAGVKVRMVTGDNIRTAKAIALECGILSSAQDVTEPTVLEGRVFRALSEKEREQMAQKITVMGRSSPNDKLLLVQALRKGGDVVVVTGDGTNDAPALHEADIGLSMGIQGTEVAKESSDIIILDDNFASVVKVVRWGRSVYANIQKFIQFQLTVNVAALVINVVAAVSSGDVPLNSVQLLWVNLIMDTLGALALATEPPTDNLMLRPPALHQVAVLLVLNFSSLTILGLKDDGDKAHAYKVKNSLIFNAFVMCQKFNEFNARKPEEINCFRGVTKNYLFMGIVGFTLILQGHSLSSLLASNNLHRSLGCQYYYLHEPSSTAIIFLKLASCDRGEADSSSEDSGFGILRKAISTMQKGQG
ncbi:Calcium-transporting ATPase 8, plasma membrane-type [Hibiscus syriacus]|uniref:P-type Ca(2+) transporter n=1 Tax=Hibiscus syriacus TaxID=106335 RepID=A0A6A2YFZ4_HIBSY|nr:Calcium-transporting ATPase 8, plasma membrane-type [Hibiscus syriacus]